MLIVGMFFFWIAVTSGLCGSVDIFSPHAYALHVVFYSSLLLATLTFTVRLLKPSHIRDAFADEPATRPADAGTTRIEAAYAAASAPEIGAAQQCQALVIAGPLVATMH